MVPEYIGQLSIPSVDKGFIRYYHVWVNIDEETGELHSIYYTHQSLQIASSVGPLMRKDCIHPYQVTLFQQAVEHLQRQSVADDDFDVIEPFDAQEHNAHDYRNP